MSTLIKCDKRYKNIFNVKTRFIENIKIKKNA